MASDRAIRLVLLWHMHQPDYRDHLRDEFQLPWTYLHAIKDYADMAGHLEAVPGVRAVVNFSPILLEQVEHYRVQLDNCLKHATPLRDPLLAALDGAVFPAKVEQRVELVKSCLRANRRHMIERYPQYRRLAQIAELIRQDAGCSTYLSNQFLADVVTWYHLAWMGETTREGDAGIQELLEQGSGFTLHQRRMLLGSIAAVIGSLKDRYRRLADEGRIELSTSPHGHPILPLLLDFRCARDAEPDAPLPAHERYPGGAERAAWHIAEGLRVFESCFGRRPAGCWPSEGAVSAAALQMLEDAGFRWVATGENVLRNSIGKSGGDRDRPDAACGAWTPAGSRLRIFARNDRLSDAIGFRYADWHADDAVGDLIHQIEQIGDSYQGPGEPVVSIIMDGENAWEHFPRNGYYFLSALYRHLRDHPRITTTTYGEILEEKPRGELREIVAGSWVYGTLSTWIGSEDKNRGWDVLGDLKEAWDAAMAANGHDDAARERLLRQLATCEGSDWFWWFGDYNPAEQVSDFERLYRVHVANLYAMMGREPPQYLSQILSHGTGSPALGGTMRPGSRDGDA